MDHVIRYHDNPSVKLIVVLGEVGMVTVCTLHVQEVTYSYVYCRYSVYISDLDFTVTCTCVRVYDHTVPVTFTSA